MPLPIKIIGFSRMSLGDRPKEGVGTFYTATEPRLKLKSLTL
jgi:hypothetical protein